MVMIPKIQWSEEDRTGTRRIGSENRVLEVLHKRSC